MFFFGNKRNNKNIVETDPLYHHTEKRHRLNTWTIYDWQLVTIDTVACLLLDGSIIMFDVEKRLARKLYMDDLSLCGMLPADLLQDGVIRLICPSKSAQCVLFTVNSDSPLLTKKWMDEAAFLERRATNLKRIWHGALRQTRKRDVIF